MAIVNILFVCSGNTCRSPMASALLKQALKDGGLDKKIKCDSAGISAVAGLDMSENAKLALKQLGVGFRTHKSKKFELQQLKKNKFIITMTDEIKKKICSSCFGALNVYSFAEFTGSEDIPDPYGGNLEAYLDVAKYLKYQINRFLDRLVRELNL